MRRHTLHKLRNVLHSAILIVGMALIAALCALTLWGLEGVLWAFFGVALALLLSPSIPPTPRALALSGAATGPASVP